MCLKRVKGFIGWLKSVQMHEYIYIWFSIKFIYNTIIKSKMHFAYKG